MTVHAVMEKTATMSQNVDSLNKDFQCAADVDHGNVVQLLTKSTDAGEKDVWVATAPASASLLDLYMVSEVGVVTIYGPDGTEYVGINSNPQNSYVKAGKTYTAFQLHVGDLVKLTAEAFSGAKGVSDTFANPSDGLYTLVWGTSATASALNLKLVSTETITIGAGSVGTIGGTGRVVSYTMKVLAN